MKKAKKTANWFALISLVFNVSMFSVFAPEVAKAADSGYKPPTDFTSTGWSNPSRAYTSNNSYAVADAPALIGSSTPDVIAYQDFDFNVPAGAKIDGIEIKVEGRTEALRQAKVSLSWDGGTSYTAGSGVKTTNLPVGWSSSADATRYLGSATDKWNRSAWTVDELSNSNFRLKLEATYTIAATKLNLDLVEAIVYYTPNTAPTAPVLVSPTDTAYTTDSTPSFEWNASTDADNDTISYGIEISSFSDFSSYALTGGTFGTAFVPASLLADGTYYWRVRAVDNYSNYTYSSVYSFTVDTNAPEITNFTASPSSFSPAIGDTTNISYTTSDNLAGDVYASVGIYDAAGVTLLKELVSNVLPEVQGNHNVNWDGEGYTNDGEYKVKVQVRDEAGNSSEQSVSVYVDTQGPAGTYDSVVDATNPTNNNNPNTYGKYNGLVEPNAVYSSVVQYPTDIEVIKVVFEKTTGEKFYKIGQMDNLGGYTTSAGDEWTCATCLVAPFSTATLPDGTYKVIVESYDTAGNMTPELVENAQVIDTVKPGEVKNLIVTGKTDTTISLKWDAVSDADLGGYKVYYGTTNGVWTGSRDAGNVTTYTMSGLSANTNYFFKVVAYDKAMNDAIDSNIVNDTTNTTPIVLAATTTTGSTVGKASTGATAPEGAIAGATDENTGENTDNKEEKKEENKNSGFNWWWLLLLALLAGGGYYYYTKNPGVLAAFKKKKSDTYVPPTDES